MTNRLQILSEKKQQLDSRRPFPPELIDNLEDWLTVELTYSSNAIEGNTLSRKETAEVLEKGIRAVIPGKPLKDQLEAINHGKALEFIKELANNRKSHQFITEEDIKAIHTIILSGIDDTWAGKYRKIDVFIRGSNVEFPSPRKVPSLMAEFIRWLEVQQDEHPVRVASLAHFKFVSIHPFIDGNGRTGRLLMNLILAIHSYPMAIIRNEERTQYLETLEKAQTTNNLQPFFDLIEHSVERSLEAYLNAIGGKSIFPKIGVQPMQQTSQILKIGELAKTTNETPATIRFWTKEGLLRVKEYSQGGYQLYDPSQIPIVKEIRRLQKEKRLTIAEIKERLRD